MLKNEDVFAQVIEKRVLDQIQLQSLIAKMECLLVPRYLQSFSAKIYTSELKIRLNAEMKEALIKIFQASGWKVKINNLSNNDYENFEFS